MRDYRMPWLQPVALGWMRRFHNRADATLVPTRELEAGLRGSGFRHVRLLARAVDTQLFDPARRSEAVRNSWARNASPSEMPMIVSDWPAAASGCVGSGVSVIVTKSA